MPVRVDLIDEAVEDMIRVEEVGSDAGLPLGGGLAGWRKIVVGDRNWRIIFTVDPAATIATVWVIGDRSDSQCYEEAQRRVRALGKTLPQGTS